MKLEILAAVGAVALLIAGLCVRPIEGALRELRDRQRKTRRRRRVE